MKIEVYSPTIRRKEMDAVLTALVEDRIGPGEQTRLLIQIAREKLKFDYCMALRSPATALFIGLKSLNLEDGKGVVVSALSPRYYARVIEDLRLVPLYCDVLPSSAVIGRETVEKALASRPEGLDVRAVVLHHTLGYVPDTPAIAELGLPVIEDCSQSFGTVIAGIPAGNAGVFTIMGLEERDMLTAGSGALLYAANRRDASVLRNLGELPPEYGLPDMNAAMGVVQFRESARNLDKRREIAKIYIQAAMRTRHKQFVQSDTFEYNNYAFPLILETGMKDVKAYAKRKDIVVENAFENTLAALEGFSPEQCPEAYSLSLRTALFPLYPRLSGSETEKVSKLIVTLP
ncbi:MAG: DegT/DnrJ/EryC1/StrS family aminotransferase [Treponema sp.]|jgi:dTDP-4-amino-4,6-dideoxygalactose transaminase|nr:DegT/DnrJ/EryC1/StrS family aminotransferase [Treponema sp.]